MKCKGCEITERDSHATWGAKGHFSYVDNENCHLLQIMVHCIEEASDGALIHLSTCIWKDDRNENSSTTRKDIEDQLDGKSVLDSLEDAAQRGCRIWLTKSVTDGSNEYQSEHMNQLLENFANTFKSPIGNDVQPQVIYKPNEAHFIHAKFVTISSLRLNNRIAKYFGLACGDNQEVKDVSMITSHNVSKFDANKYQDLVLTWNWADQDTTEKTPATFTYDKCVHYFDVITRDTKDPNVYTAHDKILTDPASPHVGMLYYPRNLPSLYTANDAFIQFDPVVRFLDKFEHIESIYIAMAYWQGVIWPFYKNEPYSFHRRGITDRLQERVMNDNCDISIVLNQMLAPAIPATEGPLNSVFPNIKVYPYHEDAIAVPEFFHLRDCIAKRTGIQNAEVPIYIVNDNGQQKTPYVHSKYMIVKGTPSERMDEPLRGSRKYLWAGSSNFDDYGAWNNAEMTVLVGDATKQGAELIQHYEDNFSALQQRGRRFEENATIVVGKTYGDYKTVK